MALDRNTVARVQAELNVLGYRDARAAQLVVDGILGPATRGALARFQHDHGLVADGVLSESTRGWLDEELGLRAADMPYHPAHTSVPRTAPLARAAWGPPAYAWLPGASVARVSDVQLALNVLGYLCPKGLPLLVNGQLDTFTRAALRTFQADPDVQAANPGLVADGALTDRTRFALERALAGLGWNDVDFRSAALRGRFARAAAPATATGLGTIIPSTYRPRPSGYDAPDDTTTGLGFGALLGLAALGGGAYYLGRRAAQSQAHATAGRLQHFEPYARSSRWAFPWPGHAEGEVILSPRQLGDPLEAALRTEWMGAQGFGAQYIMHDQDTKGDLEPTPAYRWHWLDDSSPETEHD